MALRALVTALIAVAVATVPATPAASAAPTGGKDCVTTTDSDSHHMESESVTIDFGPSQSGGDFWEVTPHEGWTLANVTVNATNFTTGDIQTYHGASGTTEDHYFIQDVTARACHETATEPPTTDGCASTTYHRSDDSANGGKESQSVSISVGHAGPQEHWVASAKESWTLQSVSGIEHSTQTDETRPISGAEGDTDIGFYVQKLTARACQETTITEPPLSGPHVAGTGATLARTGSDHAPALVLVSTVLIALGSACLLVRRRFVS